MKTIKLTKNKYAIIDDDQYDSLSLYKWHAALRMKSKWYAVTTINGKKMSMHRFLLEPPKGLEIDHINGNSLDNRISNLRSCTHAQNMRNRKLNINNKTGYKGVFMSSSKNKYRAQIRANGIAIHLGYFENALDAYKSYLSAATKIDKSFYIPLI